MMQHRLYYWLVVCAWLPIPALAGEGDCTPPPNETCSGEIVFGNDDLPYDVTAPLGCVNNIVDRPYFDVFYRFDCTCTGDYTVNMCDSSGDTYLRIYIGACGWVGGSEFAVGDDECPGSPPNADPMITVHLEAGTSYWFELGTWRPDPPWAPPPNSPYNFRVSQCECTPPFVSMQPVDQAVCLGGAAVFSVEVGGDGPLTYQWRRDGLPIAGAVESVLVIDGVTGGDAGEYDVVVTDVCDAVVSESATLTVSTSGDFDGDGVVAAADVQAFVDCVGRPDSPYRADCACGDGDLDGDVDFADFATIQVVFSGG